MPSADFNPAELTVDASLNRVIMSALAGEEIAGMRAEDACSRDALHALAAGRGLTGLRPGWLATDLASAVASADAATQRAATAVLTTFGRRLGALIATLREPGTPDEQADTPARHAFLSHWLRVDSVWLCGGLLAGGCGRVVATAARAAVAAAALPCRVAVTPRPAIAPLLGAARHALTAGAGEQIAVADMGHTSIRTAVAEGGRLAQAQVRPAPSRRSPEEVEGAVADALTGVVRRAAQDRSRPVRLVVAIASYVTAGVPVDNGISVYGCLAGRTTSLRTRVARGSGAELTLEFVHDGTAAAAAGSVNSATITAGTWLGVGFRPARAGAHASSSRTASTRL